MRRAGSGRGGSDGGAGERSAARGARGARRTRRTAARLGVALVLAAATTAAAVVAGGAGGGPPGTGGGVGPAPGAVVAYEQLAAEDVDAGVAALQAHLRAQPEDAAGWASLALAYVEQARTTGDPTRYPQAERAVARSLRLRPPAANDAALAARAALAAARHDFAGALRAADRALAVNPYGERALAVRVDALVELGRHGAALRAAETADSRRPGIPVFTRYAHVLELHGEAAAARRVLARARETARTPGDVVYVAVQEGGLAFSQGRHGEALRHFDRALTADPASSAALEGRGRVRAALGATGAALRDLEQAVRRAPLPGPLLALGELYEATGRIGEAREQYALIAVWADLARANGVATGLETALAAADHGSAAEALRAARDEWSRRRTPHTADALAWALHAAGRDGEALPYARRATAYGLRSAELLYHRGVIERAVGAKAAARRSLTAALTLNPGFSPTGARAAREALESLDGAR